MEDLERIVFCCYFAGLAGVNEFYLFYLALRTSLSFLAFSDITFLNIINITFISLVYSIILSLFFVVIALILLVISRI